jgi:hypothetical protein
MSFEPRIVTIPLAGALTGADDSGLVFRAPATAKGGGLTITEMYYVPLATTSSTISFTLVPLIYSALGTPALAGTVAAGKGGTTDHWAAGVPKAFTITNGTLTAGQWLVIHKTEATSTSDPDGWLVFTYVMGN